MPITTETEPLIAIGGSVSLRRTSYRPNSLQINRLTYVNRSALDVALVPFGVVTVTSTLPEPGGTSATIRLSDTWMKAVPCVPKNQFADEPKSTSVAPPRFFPPMSATENAVPKCGNTPVTTGAAFDLTVNVAGAESVGPSALVNAARYSSPDSPVVASLMVREVDVAPDTGANVVPPSADTSHCTDGAAQPGGVEAAAVNVAD